MLPELGMLEHFHFLRPAWALIVVPWLFIVLIQNRREASRDMFGGIIAPHLLEHLRLQRADSRWFNPRSLTTVLTALMLIVLMGPSWRQQPSPLAQDEAALVIMLDVSASMRQKDVQPSRLQRAKQKIADLLAMRPDKKTALIVYAGSAHTVLTLTADQEILNQYLAAITTGMMPRPGKFPEYSLALVDEVLRESTAPATLVLFTDGLGANSAADFASYFADSAYQLVVVGVGTQEPGDGLAPLERRSLQKLASASDGTYLDLSLDDGDMRRVNRRIDNHYVIVEDSALPWLDSGYPLLFPAMLLFLMWFRKGWTLTWSWLLLPLVLTGTPAPVVAQQQSPGRAEQTASAQSATAEPITAEPQTVEPGSPLAAAGSWFADLWLTSDQQGRLLMQWQYYDAAANRFVDPMWKGLAYYYAEDFMLAAEYFSRSDSDDALFDEANARAHARDYLRAVRRYDQLLAHNPEYPGAASNRQRVQELIDEINRLSESQQQEPGVSGENKELGSDDAIPADGADEISWEQAELVQLSAEDILQDPATSDMWLRGLQQDPSQFLAIKFSMQLEQGSAGQGGGQ